MIKLSFFYVILCYENLLCQISNVILVYYKFHVFKIHYDIVSSTRNITSEIWLKLTPPKNTRCSSVAWSPPLQRTSSTHRSTASSTRQSYPYKCWLGWIIQCHSTATFMLLNAAYISMQFIHNFKQYNNVDNHYLIKFIMCTLVSRVHMKFYILTKWYTAPGIQGTHDKLNQILDV